MKRFLLLLLVTSCSLICSHAHQGQVVEDAKPTRNQQVADKKYDVSKEFSNHDFTGQVLTSRKFDDLVLYNSCFSQELPDTQVFPWDVKNLTIINSNLDNVWIPSGVTVIGGSQRRFKAQPDGKDWEVDKDDKPVKAIQ